MSSLLRGTTKRRDCLREDVVSFRSKGLSLCENLLIPWRVCRNSCQVIAQKTYLERHDPDLIGKLSEYLTWIKEPKEDRTEGMIELMDMCTV